MGMTTGGDRTAVVGFCGLAAEGGAGIHAPVFAHPEGWYFIGDPETSATTAARWAEADLVELEARGALCRTAPRWARQPGGVILCAHPAFLHPGGRALDLHGRIAGLVHEVRIGLYLGYFPRDEALGRMAAWAERLLDDANEHLRPGRPRSEWERALDSAQRARVVSPLELPEARIEAFKLTAAAWLALGRDAEDMRWDAETEDDAEALLHVLDEHAIPRSEFVRSRPEAPTRAPSPVLRVGSAPGRGGARVQRAA